MGDSLEHKSDVIAKRFRIFIIEFSLKWLRKKVEDLENMMGRRWEDAIILLSVKIYLNTV